MKRAVTLIFALLVTVGVIVPASGSAIPHTSLDPCSDSLVNGRRIGQIDTSQCPPLSAVNPPLPEVLPPPPITGHHKKGASPDPILRRVARQVTHGWSERTGSLDELERLFNAGERLYILCGHVALLGQRILARNGFDSRVVVTVTKDQYNGWDDDHALLEVRKGSRWVVYDLDGNNQPLDKKGRELSVVQLTRAKQIRERPLAHDQSWDVRGLQEAGYPLAIAPYIGRNYESTKGHLAWYKRILGVPIIQVGDQMVYHDDQQRDRIATLGSGSYHYVDQATWAPILREELQKGRMARGSKKTRRSR
jgi:hypothetical protein